MGRLKELSLRAFKDIAYIDYRALGLFRIGLGFVLFFDLLMKSLDTTAFYTDRGILSREMVTQDLGWWSFSFHLANGSYFFQMLLFVVGFVLAIALAAGYQSRLTVVLMWIFTVSLQERNGLILHSGDALIRLTLFWSMFVPLGARYSVDNLLEPSLRTRYKEPGIANLASLALLLQLLYVYFFTALLKNHPEWNENYLAVYYTLNLGQFTTAIGNLLRDFVGLTKFLTFTTYYLELIGPMLLIIPFIQRYVRCVVPLLFMGLHFSLFLTMNLGLFPWICIAAWTYFLPGPVMDLVGKYYIDAIRLPKRTAKLWKSKVQPHLPAPMTWKRPPAARTLATGFIAICLICATAWNIGTIKSFNFKRPQIVRSITLLLHLDQYWSMFAPNPMRADGWFVVEGVLRDGTTPGTKWIRPGSCPSTSSGCIARRNGESISPTCGWETTATVAISWHSENSSVESGTISREIVRTKKSCRRTICI